MLKLSKGHSLYIFNSAWMILELTSRIISVAFVSFYLARLLGPEKFGNYSFLLAILAISMAISKLGMDAVLVKKLSIGTPAENQRSITTAFWILIASATSTIIITSSSFLILSKDSREAILISIIMLSIFFQPFQVLDYHFQSEAKAKYSSICRSLSTIIASIARVLIVYTGLDIIWLVAASIFEQALIAAGLLCLHKAVKMPSFRLHPADKQEAITILKSSLPLTISSIVLILNIRIDQIIIKIILGEAQLGIYSAATKIYEAWINFPIALSVSLLPLLARLKTTDTHKYITIFIITTRALFWGSALVACTVTILSKNIISFIFGSDYIQGANALSIVMWAGAFSAIGSMTTRILNIEGLEFKIAQRATLCLTLNIALNFALIPIYGIDGSAIATLISIFCSNFLVDYIDPRLKEISRAKTAAIFFTKLIKDGK